MPLKVADANATAIPVADTGQTAADTVVLPVPYIRQAPGPGEPAYKELCWAACCATVTQALNNCYPGQFVSLPQTICQVATKALERNCCPNPDSAGCDVTADICAVYKACGLLCTLWKNFFDWDAIEDEIGVKKRPIEVYFLWTNETSHVALVSGYKTSTKELYALDPLHGYGWHRYDDVLNGYGLGGSWILTYYGIGNSLG